MTAQTNPTESAAKRSPAEAVAAISRRVKKVVSITQTQGEFSSDLDGLPGPMSVMLGEVPAVAELTGSQLHVAVGFVFKARPQNAEANDPAEHYPLEVMASYRITYELELGEEAPNPTELQAFGEINGRFNATSYWREYLHNSLGRAGLPLFFVSPFDAASRIARLAGEKPKQVGTAAKSQS